MIYANRAIECTFIVAAMEGTVVATGWSTCLCTVTHVLINGGRQFRTQGTGRCGGYARAGSVFTAMDTARDEGSDLKLSAWSSISSTRSQI